MEKNPGMISFSQKYIGELKRVLDEFPHDNFNRLIEVLLQAYKRGKHIFVMGNGGSASTASHWVCDINKGCSSNKTNKFKMMNLSESISTILAYANDICFEEIFVEQLKNFFVPGDVVIGLSGSGNSPNVLKAIDYANVNGGITVGLCGFSGGLLLKQVQIPIWAPVHDMQKAEDFHMIVAHMVMQRLWYELNERSDGMHATCMAVYPDFDLKSALTG
jgi:D-sedoheptulose 7-phosphate isomerase